MGRTPSLSDKQSVAQRVIPACRQAGSTRIRPLADIEIKDPESMDSGSSPE